MEVGLGEEKPMENLNKSKRKRAGLHNLRAPGITAELPQSKDKMLVSA